MNLAARPPPVGDITAYGGQSGGGRRAEGGAHQYARLSTMRYPPVGMTRLHVVHLKHALWNDPILSSPTFTSFW